MKPGDHSKGHFRHREQRNRSSSRSTYKYIPKFKKISLECEILSPVHVGTGEEIPVYEYIISDGLLYKINLDKTILFLSSEELKQFNDFNEKGNYTALRAFLTKKYADQEFRNNVTEFTVSVTDEVEEIYKEKKDDTENQLLIKLNQRNPLTKQAIIPGSSIKGAIRTALLAMLEKSHEGLIPGDAGRVEGELLGALTQRGRVNPLRDPFKHLKVEDISLPSNSTYISKVKNGIKTEEEFFTIDIQMIHEVTQSTLTEQQVEFRVDLLITSEFKIFKNGKTFKITPQILINACRTYYKERLENIEARYFSKTPIQSEINKIHNSVNYNNEEFLLRVGRFSGKMSLTLDKHRVGGEPKSRNLADGRYPMGWIKCKRIK